ncbi:hypothetical protein ColKHC_01889 [Colletotrichum higginsianum]|nr:hypothetical protein ColKHC_01889 [Colletotrichum higginsianum]
MVGRVEKTANDYEWDASQISISQVAHRHASEILPGDVFRRSASSIEDFICGIKPIFCSSITQQIRLNLDNFDAVAGIECTEAFLGKKTIGDWLLHIITEFLKPLTVSLTWTTTPTTRQLSMMKEDQKRLHHDPENLNPAWTPRQAGSSPVYHGSIVSNPHWALQFTNNPFDALDARTNANQMVTDAFGVIFTTFSPLRAFL